MIHSVRVLDTQYHKVEQVLDIYYMGRVISVESTGENLLIFPGSKWGFPKHYNTQHTTTPTVIKKC